MTTTYQGILQRLRTIDVASLELSDASGNPYYIVEWKAEVCPPGQAEKFYAWGYMFSADGNLHHRWGKVPVL